MKQRRSILERPLYLAAVPILVVAMLPFWLRSLGSNSPALISLALGIALLGGLYYLNTRRVRRNRIRDLTTCDWRRCLYCYFDLRGLPDHGTCPECGEEFTIDEVRDKWKRTFAPETLPVKRD